MRCTTLVLLLVACTETPPTDAGRDAAVDAPRAADASIDASMDARDVNEGTDASIADTLPDAPPVEPSWAWVNPTPQGNTLNGCGLESATAGWAVGARGTTIRVEDGTFTVVPAPTDADLYAVAPVSASLAWAVGERGVLRWDGTAWAPIATPASALYDVWASGPDHAVAVALSGHVIEWDGAVWSTVEVGDVGAKYSIRGVSPGDYWAVGERVHHVVGGTWTEVTPPIAGEDYWVQVTARAPDDVWLLARNGTIARWDGESIAVVDAPADALSIAVVGAMELWAARGALSVLDGTDWRSVGGAQLSRIEARDGGVLAVGLRGEVVHVRDVTAPTELVTAGEDRVNGSLEAVFALADDDIWVASPASAQPVLHWDGVDLLPPPDGLGSLGAYGIDGTGPNDVWFAGGTLVHWDGSARELVTSTARTFHDVVALEPGHALAVGLNGEIVEAGPGGVVAHDSGTTRTLEGAWAASATDVFVVGEAGTILRWDGTAWSAMSSGVTASLFAVTGRGPSDVWAAGDAGTILHWDGATWSALESDADAHFRGMVESAGTLWLVGWEPGSGAGEIWRSVEGGLEELPGTGDMLTDVAALPDGTLWAVGRSSQVLRRPAP